MPQHLEGLLAGRLPPSECWEVEAHVEVCANCQKTLGDLAADLPGGSAALPPRGPRHLAGEPGAAFLRRLKERPHRFFGKNRGSAFRIWP
jgi:hypothetical protein